MGRQREIQRAVLAPLRGQPEPELAVRAALDHPEALLSRLAADRLGPLWIHALDALISPAAVPGPLRARIEADRIAATARALGQEQLARDVTTVLASAGLEHAFFKGVHLRRVLYSEPGLRRSDDVDVLVSAAAREPALAALARAGFVARPPKYPTQHTRTLSRMGLDVDLHWRLFTRGRTRFDPSPALLRDRVVAGSLPVLDALGTSLVLTAGTALGDYVTGRLLRAVELDRWVRQGRVPWDALVALTHRLGIATAAWATLAWTEALLATPVPADPIRQLAPRRWRRLYLRTLIAGDPARWHERSPALTRAAFGLALEDTLSDAARAVLARLTT